MPTLLAVVCCAGCGNNLIQVPPSPFPVSDDAFSVDTVARGFTIPYGLAIVGEDEYLISDRVGKLFHYSGGELSEVEGMPPVATFGTPGIPAILHGGLMDLSLHPDYRENGLIYACYLDMEGTARVSRFRVEVGRAMDIDTIFSTRQPNWSGNGMRIVWQDSTHFLLNVGNSDWSTAANPVLYAQDLTIGAGKIHRLLADGAVPPDNPVLPGPTTIWSYGHRDVQGLVSEEATQTLFGIEHGPQGGDEFNVIEQGRNYGWPNFSYGINYDGATVSTISEDSAATFTILPEHYWTVPTNYGAGTGSPLSAYADELPYFTPSGRYGPRPILSLFRAGKRVRAQSISGMKRMNPFSTSYAEDTPDEVLVEEIKAGNKRSLNGLILRHQPFIYNIAWKMVGDPGQAEDLTQEALLKIITSLASFRGQSSFRTWAYRIVRNHFLNERVKPANQFAANFADLGHLLDSSPDRELRADEQADKAAEIREVRLQCLSGMLLCLTKEQRLIYIIGDIFNADHHVGSEIMEISRDNYRKKLSRARRDLYNFMQHKCGLVNKANPCRCHKKVTVALANGMVDAKNLLYNRKELTTFKAALVRDADYLVDESEQLYSELHRQHSYKTTFERKNFLETVLNSPNWRDRLQLD